MPKPSDHTILIATSVHIWNDPRVFFKEARTLAARYQVEYMAVAQDRSFTRDGIAITGLEFPRNARTRLKNQVKILCRGMRNYRVIHIHDPELLWVGLVWALLGKPVVYDMHEDVMAVLGRKGPLARCLGRGLRRLERAGTHLFAAFIIAEDSYRNCFPPTRSLVAIHNYVCVDPRPVVDRAARSPVTLLYVGKCSVIRGTKDVVEAVRRVREAGTDLRLILIGSSRDPAFVDQLEDWNRTHAWLTWTGWLSLEEMVPWIRRASLGVAPLHHVPNYEHSLPTKIFDYMNWGLPYLYSDLEINRRFFSESTGGVEFPAGDVAA
ncbi:MAG: glycosyltransferase, partial [Candidatus Neomarinimicrobiota bacterium]